MAWTQDTELLAGILESVRAALAGMAQDSSLYASVPRPYETNTEPEKTVGLAEFNNALKGF